MKIAYFAHDISDPAVKRRINTFYIGGANVTVFGFTRAQTNELADICPSVICFGKTYNNKFITRILLVFKAALTISWWGGSIKDSSAIVARNLEMLALAHFVRFIYRLKVPLSYESLDIHNILLGSNILSRSARLTEKILMKRTQYLIISSQAYYDNYFYNYIFRDRNKILLVENKVLFTEVNPLGTKKYGICSKLPPTKRWRIGWFGIIRCKKSLAILSTLARMFPNTIDIVIRGRIAFDQIPDFDFLINEIDNMEFKGQYDRSSELEEIYNDIDFCWAIDFFQEGKNSAWLLPNRLYESLAFGTIPIADGSVETGNWLYKNNIGIILSKSIIDDLEKLFSEMNNLKYFELVDAILNIEENKIILTDRNCIDFVKKLTNYNPPIVKRVR